MVVAVVMGVVVLVLWLSSQRNGVVILALALLMVTARLWSISCCTGPYEPLGGLRSPGPQWGGAFRALGAQLPDGGS